MPFKNSEKVRAKAREYARRYRAENKEKVKASKTAYVDRNRAKVYEYQRKWREENKETYNQQSRESYRRNIDHHKEYSKKHYQKNKEYYNQKRNEYKTAMLEWVSNMKKESGCKICGTIEQLEYHHIDPSSKIMEISVMVAKLKNRNEILEEIKKCEVLCSPCHRYTHKTKGRPRKGKKIQDNKLDNYT